ncbi:MAG: pyridoxal phosphate-dependent aminotransferase [Planctomycetia bacterium]|nr:pyridoxal phosphate-dependent aminotransferase [Planctomycetia bacterium]
MQSNLSRRIAALEPSATLAMASKAKELKAAGRKVISLSLGEPDFNTPKHICDAAAKAMQEGKTRYTVASGIPELKSAVCKFYNDRHGLDYTPANITVSNGAKHCLHNAFTVLIDEGEEVVIPAPYWVSYAELVKLAGGVPVIVETEQANDFKLTPEQLRAVCTPKTKCLLLCSPSNPTGSMYSGEELGALADVVLEKDLWVLADEIYENLVYGGNKFVSFPTVRPNLMERTILVNGVSKTYAMTGWRVGWTMAPADIAKKMGNLQSQETSNPCSISQYAAVAALEGSQDCVEEMRREFEKRLEYVTKRIESIDGISCPKMSGAFYAFVNISEQLGRTYDGKMIETDTDWCLELLEKKGVATVMGSAFGAPGYARLSFANSMEELETAFDLIEEFLAEK